MIIDMRGKTKKTTPLEKHIEKQIIVWLNLDQKCMAWKNQTTGVYDPGRKCFRTFHGLKGVSDILGVWHGKPLAIEVKKPKSYPTPDQRKFIANFKAQGGIAFVARSIEDCQKEFAKVIL